MFQAQLAMDQTLNAWHCLKGTQKSHGKLGTQPSLLTLEATRVPPIEIPQGSWDPVFLRGAAPFNTASKKRAAKVQSLCRLALEDWKMHLRYTDGFFHTIQSPKNGWDKVCSRFRERCIYTLCSINYVS